MRSKNLLMIVIDCLRADVAYSMSSQGKLKFINELIRKSVSFHDNFATSCTTTPSFASMLTGLYPARHGVKMHSGQKLRPWLDTLPQVLSEAKYYTRAEVTGPLVKEVGLNRGFKSYNYRDRNVTVYTEWWTKMLRDLSQLPEPWFFLLHLWELHVPRYLPDSTKGNPISFNRYIKALRNLDNKIGDLFDYIDLDKTAVILLGDHGEYFPNRLPEKLSAYIKYNYKRALRKMAKGPMRFLNNLAKKTLLEMGHGFHVYDSLMKVPLIIYDPDSENSDLTVHYLTSNVDILPTALSILGIRRKVIQNLDGVDLITSLKKNKKPHEFVILEAAGRKLTKENQIIAIRTERFKYVLWPNRRPIKEELYDLSRDPHEKENVINEHRELAEVFREHLINNYLRASKKQAYILKVKKKLKDGA